MELTGNPCGLATFAYGLLLLLSVVARGEDPPKEGTKGKEYIFVQAADLAAGVPVEARLGGLLAIDSESFKWKFIASPEVMGGSVSPNGRWLVCTRRGKGVQIVGTWLYDLRGDEPPRMIFGGRGVPFWSDDGKHINIGAAVSNREFVTWRVNVDGTELTKLPLPETDLFTDCSRDGTWLLGSSLGAAGTSWGRIVLAHADGTGMHTVVEGKSSMTFAQISPDGKTVAYVENAFQVGAIASLWLVDANGANRRRVPLNVNPAARIRVCWSPDGSRLALGLWIRDGDRIALVDPDGKNCKTLSLPPLSLTLQDWK